MSEHILRFFGKIRGVFFPDVWRRYSHEKHLVNQPFSFETDDAEKAVLLIHGWTSTPYEFRRLGNYLHKKGYAVYAPILRGHGSVPRDLEGITWRDWLSDTDQIYRDLKRRYKKVYVGGNSVGGSLSLLLAQHHRDINGILLFGTPYKMRLERMGYWWTKCTLLFRKYKRKFYPPSPRISAAITRAIAYNSYPVKSALEAFYAISESRKNLASIIAPCYIAQSQNDHLISRRSIDEISVRISSGTIRRRIIKNAYHTFISDAENSYLFKDIVKFLEKN